jgi:hypothetical protein
MIRTAPVNRRTSRPGNDISEGFAELDGGSENVRHFGWLRVWSDPLRRYGTGAVQPQLPLPRLPAGVRRRVRSRATIRAGSLDDPGSFAPTRDIFTASAQPWDYMNPDLPKASRLGN